LGYGDIEKIRETKNSCKLVRMMPLTSMLLYSCIIILILVKISNLYIYLTLFIYIQTYPRIYIFGKLPYRRIAVSVSVSVSLYPGNIGTGEDTEGLPPPAPWRSWRVMRLRRGRPCPTASASCRGQRRRSRGAHVAEDERVLHCFSWKKGPVAFAITRQGPAPGVEDADVTVVTAEEATTLTTCCRWC
jgi:hypothetical protein